MIKSLMLAAATAGVLAIGTLATPSTAKADYCPRGGYGGGFGPGYGGGYSVGFGPRYGYRPYGPVYVAPRRSVSYYRGYGYSPRPYYGPRRGGFNLVIGF